VRVVNFRQSLPGILGEKPLHLVSLRHKPFRLLTSSHRFVRHREGRQVAELPVSFHSATPLGKFRRAILPAGQWVQVRIPAR